MDITIIINDSEFIFKLLDCDTFDAIKVFTEAILDKKHIQSVIRVNKENFEIDRSGKVGMNLDRQPIHERVIIHYYDISVALIPYGGFNLVKFVDMLNKNDRQITAIKI